MAQKQNTEAKGAQKNTDTITSKKRSKKILRSVVNVLVLLFVFWVGLNIGNGSIGIRGSVTANKTLPKNLNYDDTERIYDLLRANYDGKISATKLQDGLKSGLVKATGDPYTDYFNAKEAKDFNDQLSGTFSGIGAQLGKDDKNNVIIMSPLSGYPADKAGLRAKDIIVSINGKSTADLSIDEAVSHIRGKKGTVVKLDILRGTERKDFKITREDIKVPSVKSEIISGNVGYIQITQFGEDTSRLVNKAAMDFEKRHVKGVVLDMRSNPGGLLPSAVDVASVWLPNGKTVLQEKRDGKVTQTYTAFGRATLVNTPTVVLIDEGSASASEIVAGALKDSKAATLIGTKSYGKGSVQEIIKLNNGAELKVTVARWYRPNGENIDKKGIKPDQQVTMTEEDYKKGIDPQKDAALQFLQK